MEEDLPDHAVPHLLATLGEAEVTIAALLARVGHGTLLRDGVRVVLAGKPNVGKSSLLNALLRRDRAIVTPIPGTTRDTLEEASDIHGLPMFLVDTAGLAESEDVVERLGIARGTEALRHAAIILLIVDGSRQPDDADRRAALTVRDTAPCTPLLLAVNKCDLPDGALVGAYEALLAGTEPAARVVRCSAGSGAGLSEIEDTLADLALGGEALDAGSTLVESPRQRQALEEATAALAARADGTWRGPGTGTGLHRPAGRAPGTRRRDRAGCGRGGARSPVRGVLHRQVGIAAPEADLQVSWKR